MALTRAQTFGKVLRELRTERGGLNQVGAALAANLDRGCFSRIERGTKNPPLATVWKIADTLETRPSDLLARAERLLEET